MITKFVIDMIIQFSACFVNSRIIAKINKMLRFRKNNNLFLILLILSMPLPAGFEKNLISSLSMGQVALKFCSP